MPRCPMKGFAERFPDIESHGLVTSPQAHNAALSRWRTCPTASARCTLYKTGASQAAHWECGHEAESRSRGGSVGHGLPRAQPAQRLHVQPTARRRKPTVTDGDTIKLKGVTYRLWGIDAPETKQRCADYPSGALATGMLVKLMKGKTITCEDRGLDRYGRTIGLCRADGQDLGADMVRLGMAWAFVRYSRDYVEQEVRARADNLGIHAHGCEPAWEWRAVMRGKQ
jgi:endonuclease YncB( thermonuclease family)